MEAILEETVILFCCLFFFDHFDVLVDSVSRMSVVLLWELGHCRLWSK